MAHSAPAYGSWEQVASTIAEGLLGHRVDVTLDSVTAGELDGVCPHGYAEDPSLEAGYVEALHVAHAPAHCSEFDLVHNHLDWLPLAFAGVLADPVL